MRGAVKVVMAAFLSAVTLLLVVMVVLSIWSKLADDRAWAKIEREAKADNPDVDALIDIALDDGYDSKVRVLAIEVVFHRVDRGNAQKVKDLLPLFCQEDDFVSSMLLSTAEKAYNSGRMPKNIFASLLWKAREAATGGPQKLAEETMKKYGFCAERVREDSDQRRGD